MTKAEIIAYINNLDIKNVKSLAILFIDNSDKQITTNINC